MEELTLQVSYFIPFIWFRRKKFSSDQVRLYSLP